MDDKKDKIRERAHQLWESEGRPHGAHDEHWRRAQAEHDATHRQADIAETDHHDAGAREPQNKVLKQPGQKRK
jgi:hypothetical protein